MSVPTAQTIAVGGATVGYYTYGSSDGEPVLVFHGTPASGAGFAWADQPATSRGLRLIAPDRPGVGLSSRATDWTVGTYPTMVAAFADAMGLDRFAVWGYSGGGPYAVATAAKLAGRVTAAAVTAGMGQIPAWASVDEFEKTDRQFLVMATKRPRLARALLGMVGRLARLSPASAMRSFDKQLSAPDKAVIEMLGTPSEAMALFTQAFLRGSAGVVDDYAALANPWDVDLAAIECPLFVGHATADQMVPIAHSIALAERVASATMVIWPDEGHLATVTHVGEILDALRRS
jgi:pimeloyl-ACP methyl ester carboxylesterase